MKTIWKPYENHMKAIWKPHENHMKTKWNPYENIWKPYENHMKTKWKPYENHMQNHTKTYENHMETIACWCSLLLAKTGQTQAQQWKKRRFPFLVQSGSWGRFQNTVKHKEKSTFWGAIANLKPTWGNLRQLEANLRPTWGQLEASIGQHRSA